MKSIIDILAEPLDLIFNKYISESYFPDDIEIAQIIPIFKAGDKKNDNYRPISILTMFSNIFEKINMYIYIFPMLCWNKLYHVS